LQNLLTRCSQSQELMQQGFTEEDIVVKLLGPEDGLAKLSKFNISKGNLIRQTLRHPLN
jgi:hypothetical protein